jgi:DNA modification methylase
MRDIKENKGLKPIRAFLFACTNKSEKECLIGLVFGTEKIYGPVVIRIRKGDLLFLNNLDTNTLFGVFRAVSDGKHDIKKDAFAGKYPYQVAVEPIGTVKAYEEANKLLSKYGVKRNTPIFGNRLAAFLSSFITAEPQLLLGASRVQHIEDAVSELIRQIQDSPFTIDIEEEIPLIESTTLWDFPKQSYGPTPKGDNKYAGVTPALIIFNMVWRYTEPGDLVVDPMCGSGTTIDVCKAEQRKSIGYDIKPTRPDIIQNDARHIPLENNSVDMMFIDSPYSDNIRYNEHPDNIGHISAETLEFYTALEEVMKEAHRVLKDGKALGWLIGDQWVKKTFTPVGFNIYESLCKYFQPVELICVTRKNQYSNTGLWHNRARRLNFYLRGFKYLIIVKKSNLANISNKSHKVKWTYYDRQKEVKDE